MPALLLPQSSWGGEDILSTFSSGRFTSLSAKKILLSFAIVPTCEVVISVTSPIFTRLTGPSDTRTADHHYPQVPNLRSQPATDKTDHGQNRVCAEYMQLQPTTDKSDHGQNCVCAECVQIFLYYYPLQRSTHLHSSRCYKQSVGDLTEPGECVHRLKTKVTAYLSM